MLYLTPRDDEKDEHVFLFCLQWPHGPVFDYKAMLWTSILPLALPPPRLLSKTLQRKKKKQNELYISFT